MVNESATSATSTDDPRGQTSTESGVPRETRKLMLYDANKKSTAIAYCLWFFFGWFGVHRFYLGYTGSAFAILALVVLGAALLFVGVGLFILLIPAFWLFVDIFLIPGMVREKNNNLIQMLS